MSLHRIGLGVLLALGLAGCAGTGALRTRSLAPPAELEQGVVYVVPTAGDYRLIVSGLHRSICQAGLPLRVEPINWASGHIVQDIQDQTKHQRGGTELVRRVTAYRKAFPGRRVYVVSHSAGAAVVVAAARCLPAGSIDRVVLLAPGIPQDQDLRPTLTASAQGIDVFYSEGDSFLRTVVSAVGTTERRGVRSVGEVGCKPTITCAEDQALYGKLRQHPWQKDYAQAGYLGGHFGLARSAFLSRHVVPMLSAG